MVIPPARVNRRPVQVGRVAQKGKQTLTYSFTIYTRYKAAQQRVIPRTRRTLSG